jgi:glucose-6-phosphate dehydrogenase assembly protein OpcA
MSLHSLRTLQQEMLEFPRLIYDSLVSAARQFAQPYRFDIMKEAYKSNIYETLLEEKNQAEREEQLRKAKEQHRRMVVKRAQMPAQVASGGKTVMHELMMCTVV